jgi:predicted  nucleic acid-binding Zn-ribbon protein
MRLDPVQPSHQRANKRKRKAAQAAEPVIEVADEPSLHDIAAELEEKLSQAQARRAAIKSERNAISLAAHMGSADDRARLDRLNQEGAILSGEIEGIEAAIAQVKAQIIEAETAAVKEAERKKRREIARLADEVRAHADKIDGLWRQSIAEYLIYQGKLHEIAQGSGGRPALHVVQSACRQLVRGTDRL